MKEVLFSTTGSSSKFYNAVHRSMFRFASFFPLFCFICLTLKMSFENPVSLVIARDSLNEKTCLDVTVWMKNRIFLCILLRTPTAHLPFERKLSSN